MLGKNNYHERLRKMELLDKQDHFSIRKLSIGAASVLLGFTFFGLNSQSVKADTVKSVQQISEKSNEDHSNTETNLSTFSGLSSFLRDTKDSKPKNANDKNKSNSQIAEDKIDSDNKDTTVDNNNNNENISSTISGEESQDDTADKNPIDKDNSDNNNSDNATSKDNTNGVTDKNKIDKKESNDLKVENGVAQIYSWDQFEKAFQDTNISKISIMKNIVSSSTGTEQSFKVTGHKLVIESGDDQKHIIDFKGRHPDLVGNSKLDITFKNLKIWSSDWYGVVRTDHYSYNASKDNTALITFDNVEFYGNQLLYVGSHNEIHIKNKVIADQKKSPYNSPVDGSQANGAVNNSQIFEFTNSDNSLYFDEGSEFIGNTLNGTAIEMRGKNCNVYIAKGAKVTLNPLRNSDGSFSPDSGQNGTIYGIMIGGGSVNVKGHLAINIGSSDYKGTRDNKVAKAIYLGDSNSSLVIDSNVDRTGGIVDVKTNGNISRKDSNDLITDLGNLIVKPNAALNVTGENMGDYSGTLISIKGKGDFENSALNVKLQGDAGNEAITLIDAPGDLTINNPTSLILDAHLNQNPGTTIFGNNQVNITNVRQVLTYDKEDLNKKLTIPPFHVLQVKHTSNGMEIGKVEMLNGKRTLSKELASQLKADQGVQAILKEYPDIAVKLDPDSGSYIGQTFDNIFADAMKIALSNSKYPGYNNIAFKPANPTGFLDIDTDKNDVTIDYIDDESNPDNSLAVITGYIKNYDNSLDGPDTSGIFNSILNLPGGTDPYIKIVIKDSSGKETTLIPKGFNEDPYVDTDDEILPLEHHFAGKAVYDEITEEYKFTITIPTSELLKGSSIALYPDANFVEYNPLSLSLAPTDTNLRPIVKNILAQAQNTAAKAIQDKINEVEGAELDLTADEKQKLTDALNDAKAAIANPGSDGVSVYASDVKDVPTVNDRKKAALDKLEQAFETAQEASSKASAVKKAQAAANKAISTAAQEAITRVKTSGLSEDKQKQYIDAINNAKDTALQNPSTDKNSIYNPDNASADITNIEKSVSDKINKEAAKAEVAGYTEKGETTLGIVSPNTEIDEALANQLANIDKATDIGAAEDSAKKDIFDKLKAAAKTKIEESANKAKESLGVDADEGIDKAVKEAETAIDGHTSLDDIKGDITAGQDSVLAAYKDSAKKQLTEIAQADKEALGVDSDPNIDQAVENANSLIEQAGTIDLVNTNLSEGKKKVQDKFKAAAKAKIEESANKAKESLGVDADEGIDKAVEEAETAIDGHTSLDDIKGDITAGQDNVLAAYKDSAKKQINQARDNAINEINDKTKYPNLTDEDRTLLINTIKDDATEGVDKVNKETDPDLIKTDKQTAIDKINSVKSTASSKDLADLQNEKSSQLKALQDAATKAKNVIDSINDNYLSPSNKQYYKNLIDQHAASATNAINSAGNKDAIDTAEKDGENNINGDLVSAQVAAAKSQAIAELNQAKNDNKSIVNEAHTNGTLSDDDWQKDLDAIDNAYTTAITAVSNDYTPSDIVTDKNTGISAMKAVADSISQDKDKADLAKAKNKANADLRDQAQKLRGHIQEDPNLSNSEKSDYLEQIASALNNAEQAVNAADKDNVKSAHNAGIEELNNIRNNADLQSARDKALTNLQNEFNADSAAIDKLGNISTAGKDGIKTDLQNAYDNAVNKVKDPTSNTVALINSASNDGITTMENILGKAKGIDQTIADDKQKLEDFAQKATDRINGSTMTDTDKSVAITNIQKARDTAKAEVGKQTTVEDANQAEKDGEINIQKAEAMANNADLEKAKTAAKAKIDNARETALNNLKDVYDALTDVEKKQVQNAYDKAVKAIPEIADQAEAAIDTALDKDTITGLTNDAINSINSTGDTANVAMTKISAVQAIKDAANAAKAKLSKDRDKQSVEEIENLGIADINSATNSSTILAIKNNALNSINNIKDSDTGDKDKDDALWAKKNKANEDLAKELANTTAAIDKLNDLTADQKKQFKAQAQAAHDRAHIRIEGATEDQIDSEKGLGKTNIDKALTDAKLQAVKNVAKADVDKTADDAIDQVNKDDTINKDDKQNIIDNINKDRDKTKEDIDNADTPDKVNNAKQDGEGEIKGHVDNGTSSAKEKQTAKDKLAAAADKIYDRLKNDRDSGKLDYNQYQDLKDKVDNAVAAANGAISNADGTSNINGAESDGESALSGINTDIDKVEAVNTALGKLSDAVNKANDAADAVAKEVGKTEEEQQKLAKQMKDAIEKQRADAAKNIKDAQNAADDPLNAIKTAGQKGVDTITGLTNDYTDKVDQIKTLKQKADAAKDDLNKLKTDENGNPVLTASDVAQGEAEIDDAVKTGISDIYQASSVDDAKTAEQKAEVAVELAKLPTKLLAEKNKQIAAINQYATAAESDIEKFAQTDQNKNGLPADTIAELKAQVEAAKNKAISKINDVTLAEGASQTDFNEAKAKVDNAEKGVAESNETVDFGEAGIDKVKTLAQQKADVVKAKNDAIAELEQKQEEANNKIKDSGLSPSDQGPLKDQVQKLVDKAKDQIINISDTDDNGHVKTPEQVKDEADTIINNTVNGFDDQDNGVNNVPGISDIINNAQLDGAKTTAEKTLNNKRAQAHDVINGSQLTADQKQKANKAIDDAFNTEKSDIDSKTDINDVPKDEDQIGKAIDAILTKPSEWFDDEHDNALSGTDGIAGLQAGLDKLTDMQKADPDYKDYLNDINNAITAINNAQNIKDASSAYDKGMTLLNKLNALDQVKTDANKAKTNIDNSDLTDKAKDRLKGDVDKVVEDTKDKLNQIDSSVNNASTNKDKIDQITHDAQSDITTIENDFGIEDQSQDAVDANNEISQNHSDAVDTIHNEFGDDSKTPKTDDAYEKNKHVHSSSQDGINSDKTNADKEISKGAIDDAVDIAKDKVNHLKHEDGTDYTDADKNKINEQIDKDATDAKDNIDKADKVTDIDNIRDNGIHQIHQDCSDTSTIDKILHGDNNNNNNGGGIVAPVQPVTPAKNPTTNTSDKDKTDGTNDNINSVEVTLMHNAYLYDETGKRANKITLGAGSVLTTYGTKIINGRDYYVLVDKGAKNKKYYVAVGNVVAVTRKLKHNAYIYNQFGKRVKKTGVFKKGKLIKTYGAAVKIRGKKYYIIGKNRFVKAANFAKGVVAAGTAKAEVVPTSAVTEKPQVTVEKTLMHNAYLYDKNGTRANKLIFQAGSQVETVGKKTVNGKVCYELPDGMFIAAGNIDAKKLKLKHNAYVYNKYGHRANKKVLKKRKSVKTYGNSVKINGKRYFITAKGRFVKKANF